MSDRYQAFLCNHAWVVIDNQEKLPVGSDFKTQQGADNEAARLNMEAWRDSRPASSLTEPMVWGDDWEGRLLAILDKPRELERLAA